MFVCLLSLGVHSPMMTMCSLVPRLPVFLFIITDKLNYNATNRGNKEKLDAQFKKTGSVVPEVLVM